MLVSHQKDFKMKLLSCPSLKHLWAGNKSLEALIQSRYFDPKLDISEKKDKPKFYIDSQ